MTYTFCSENSYEVTQLAPVKIVFFDIDGTLLNQKTGCISELTMQTLRKLQANGIRLCIITGRPNASLPDFQDVHFDVISTFNGCFCTADSDLIYSNPIDPVDMQIVLQNAAKIGRPVSIAVRDRLAANGMDPDLQEYYRLAGLKLEVAEDFEEMLHENIYQIMIGCQESDHETLIRGTSHVKLAISWDRAVDIIPLTGGKGSAVQHTLDYFHIDPSEAIAFGDSHNDLEMLQAVGTGVAMGNASEQVKAVADRVCGSVSEDGIYHYCIENGLIE